MKAALYLRVSTDEQNAERQLHEVEQLARARGFEPVIYGEVTSALAKERPEFNRMMKDVRAGKVHAVACWALDRLHRSMQAMVNDWHELRRLNVRLLSVKEPWADTASDNPAGSLLVSVFAWVAETERKRISERTKMGVEAARRAGKNIGRPRVSPALLKLGVERVNAGGTVRATADALGLSERSLRRAMKTSPQIQNVRGGQQTSNAATCAASTVA